MFNASNNLTAARRLFGDPRRRRSGTSTLEFALALPILMLFFIGMIQYSFYFFASQSMQTLVAYAARSAVIEAKAGTLVTGTHDATSGTLSRIVPALNPKKVTLTITAPAPTSGIQTITVTATYPYSLALPPVSAPISASTKISYAN